MDGKLIIEGLILIMVFSLAFATIYAAETAKFQMAIHQKAKATFTSAVQVMSAMYLIQQIQFTLTEILETYMFKLNN